MILDTLDRFRDFEITSSFDPMGESGTLTLRNEKVGPYPTTVLWQLARYFGVLLKLLLRGPRVQTSIERSIHLVVHEG
jgi:hypothetical protein